MYKLETGKSTTPLPNAIKINIYIFILKNKAILERIEENCRKFEWFLKFMVGNFTKILSLEKKKRKRGSGNWEYQ